MNGLNQKFQEPLTQIILDSKGLMCTKMKAQTG